MDCTMPTLSPFLAWVSCQGTSPTIDDENNNEAATAINERRAAYLRRDSSWSVDVLEIDPSSYAARLPPNTASAAVVKNYEDQVSELQRFYYKRRSVSQQQQQQQQQQQVMNKKCVRTATTTTTNNDD